MEKNETNESKLDIKKKLISKDLKELLKALVVFLLIEGLFGYIGYIYSKDNNLNINHGIIYGCVFPLGFILLNSLNCDNIFTCLIYIIAYLIVVDNIPTFVGTIILIAIISIFIINFIHIEKKDRTEKIEKYYKKNDNITITQNNVTKAEDLIKRYGTENDTKNEDNLDKNIAKYDDDEYECEICFKKISKEEYELYDCMCEDCFMDLHIDNDGNFHDDENF